MAATVGNSRQQQQRRAAGGRRLCLAPARGWVAAAVRAGRRCPSRSRPPDGLAQHDGRRAAQPPARLPRVGDVQLRVEGMGGGMGSG